MYKPEVIHFDHPAAVNMVSQVSLLCKTLELVVVGLYSITCVPLLGKIGLLYIITQTSLTYFCLSLFLSLKGLVDFFLLALRKFSFSTLIYLFNDCRGYDRRI